MTEKITRSGRKKKDFLFRLTKGAWSEHIGWPGGSWSSNQKMLEKLLKEGLVEKNMIWTGRYNHPAYSINDAGRDYLMANPIFRKIGRTVIFRT